MGSRSRGAEVQVVSEGRESKNERTGGKGKRRRVVREMDTPGRRGEIMSTVLLIGSRNPPMTSSPAMTALTGVLRSLDCHVFESGVTDGVAADRPFQTLRFDLVVAEFRPQEESIGQCLGRLSSTGALPLVVTGPDLPARPRTLIEAGRERAVYLPINSSPASKLQALRALLPEQLHVRLRVGPLELNTAEGVVRYRQFALPLTSTEVRVLHSLMKSPGQTIDCGTLGQLSQCHDVPTHVGNLRRKFSGYSAGPLLRGNRQVGYAIDARHHQRATRNAGFALRDHLLHLI